MYEHCIKNFLKTYDPGHVERHSDSSDFENSTDVALVGSKFGNHSLNIDETRYDRPEKDYRVYQALSKKRHYSTVPRGRCRDGAQQQKIQLPNTKHHVPGKHLLAREREVKSRGNNQNSGDQTSVNSTKWCYSKSLIRNKVMPCLSTIFRRSNNGKEHMACIKEDGRSKKSDRDNVCCPYCKRKGLTKKGESRKIHLQPVYTVSQNIHGFPGYVIPYSEQPPSTMKVDSVIVKNSPELCIDNCTSSESEIEIIKNHTIRKRNNTTNRRSGNEMRKEYAFTKNISRCQQQQFPSKSQLKPSCQVFTSTSCQVKCGSIDSNKTAHVSCASSTLWNFLTNKIKVQTDKSETGKACHCPKPLEPCKPETCRYQNKIDLKDQKLPKLPENFLSESDSSYSNKQVTKKKAKEPQVICKCNENKKKSRSKTVDAEIQKEETRKCQQDHDIITASLAQKYNGEILCIHNPPCILINGCLNLPPPQIEVQENLWPVTQGKKSNFAQMCRKIKRTIDNKPELEQSSQYRPPYNNIKQCLPEFAREKVIQSVCNHNPPCEVVHGCYKPKYDPRLQNSCIHVPSCHKVPECLLGTNTCQNSCIHKPRCTELPLCSRKYLVLTAKENVSTQIQPKTNICRHEPPCLMIPKCLAHAIYDDYIPMGAIPGCTHQPSCEAIPACCRKSPKEMVSVQSQYPNTSCRIV